jgi:hypothetical protein
VARLTVHVGLAFLLGVACTKRSADRSQADTSASATSPVVTAADSVHVGPPCPAGATYAVGDTSNWATMIEEGKRAVLRGGGALIDTVDVLFGVHAVGRDSLLFLPVLAYEVDSAEAAMMSAPAAWPTDHVLCTPTGRRALSEMLPYFNSGFSSPSVIDSAVYYWGLNPQDEQGRYRLYAMRYAARRGQVDSLFLREEAPATDYRYFYGPPFVQDGAIVFEGGEARALSDPRAWRVIRVERPPARAGDRG